MSRNLARAGKAVVAAAVPLLLAAPAFAQQQLDVPVPTVTVVRVATLAPGAHAVVQRTATPTRNLILVTDSTSVGELAAALAVLRDSRGRQGEDLTDGFVAKIPRVDPSALGPTMTRRLAQEFERLRAAPPRPVAGVGTLPAIDIPLGPLNARADQ
jgi:hypothetical protein